MTTHLDLATHHDVESFLSTEARLADDNDYAKWEALWADDGIYWAPITPGDDPHRDTSIIFDNRRRIGVRVRQLIEGRRPTQTPRSRIVRTVSNVQLVQPGDDLGLPASLGGLEYEVGAWSSFMGVEAREDRRTLIAGRNLHLLRRVDGDFKIVLKRVLLVDSDLPLRTLSFIL